MFVPMGGALEVLGANEKVQGTLLCTENASHIHDFVRAYHYQAQL